MTTSEFTTRLGTLLNNKNLSQGEIDSFEHFAKCLKFQSPYVEMYSGDLSKVFQSFNETDLKLFIQTMNTQIEDYMD